MNILLDSRYLFGSLICISIFLLDIGVSFSGYKFTLAFFVFVFILFFSRLDSIILVLVAMFFLACLFSSLSAGMEFIDLTKITLVSIFMASIAAIGSIELNKQQKEDFINIYKNIFLLISSLAIIEFIFANIFGIFLTPSRELVTYGSFVRPFVLFKEPSILNIYLVFSFIIFDLLQKSNQQRYKFSFHKILVILIIILTVSFTGIVMLLGYVGVSYIKNYLLKEISFNNIYRLVSGIFGFFLVGFFIYLLLPDIFDKLFSRASDITLALTAINEVSLNSSVGYRITTLLSIRDYISEASLHQLLVGEGFINFNTWIYQTYAYRGGEMIEGGDVTNLYTVIFLSTGIIGSIIFAAFILSIISHVKKGYKMYLLVFIGLFMMVFGNITSPHLFIFIFTYTVIFKKYNQVRI